MDSDLPPWLDASFLATALQVGEDREPPVTVTKFSATPAVAPGENYLSRLYRVKVEYKVGEEEKFTSLVVKDPLTKGMASEMDGFYEKEPNIYNNFLPKARSLTNCEFGPKSIHCFKNNVMVLTDMKVEGSEMSDRHKQLDFAHCEQVFIALAKFHASSVACERDQPHLIDMVGQESMYKENDKFEETKRNWLRGAVKTAAKVVDEMELGKSLMDLLLRHAETVGDSAYRLCKPKLDGMNVLNHGDLWINNILFKHSTSGQIKDLRFIDFQTARYTTPVLDLITFMWTSANKEVRECRLPELCEIYRRTLNSTLESIGCEERLTGRELQDDFRDATDWVFIIICNMLPFTVCDKGHVISVEDSDVDDLNVDGIDIKYLKLFEGKNYRALLPSVLKHFSDWLSQL